MCLLTRLSENRPCEKIACNISNLDQSVPSKELSLKNVQFLRRLTAVLAEKNVKEHRRYSRCRRRSKQNRPVIKASQ